MSRRERFTPYEKEQACLDYINGNRSSAEICNCLHISTRTIQDWAAIYKKHGILGLTKKTKNRSYSKEFKMELVKKYISGEASSVDLAHQYDISSGLLRNWIRMYNANIELKDYNPKQEVYMAKARRKTTIDERKEIVNYCIEHNRNYMETAALYNVSYKRGHHKLDDEVDELERLRRENVRLKRQLEEKDMTVELLKKVKEFGRM